MKNKYYRKSARIVFGIFIAALLCVIIAAGVIYFNGLRYIKSGADIKYFGNINRTTGEIAGGRLWFETDAAAIIPQKFYIVEFRDEEIFRTMPEYSNINFNSDILGEINGALPKELTDYFPMNNFIFNLSDTRVFFRNENFEVLVKDYENLGNNIKSGEIITLEYSSDFAYWVLMPNNINPSSYKDFDVVRQNDRTRKYRGNIIEFMEKERIIYASFELKQGNFINLYLADNNIYRISYDKGPRSGDLYIGEINNNFQKHGRGLYYYDKSGDIYYGDFDGDLKTGRGEILYGTGDSYSGGLNDGRKNGEGIFRWSDGASYSGGFSDNKKHGYGVNIFADGSVYEGDYADDVKHGRGKYSWTDGSVYEGDYIDDLGEGSGIYRWPSGDYYEGEFYNGSPHGRGVYYWNTGRFYDGLFSHGLMVRNNNNN